ncbi:GntR family transcriptional regulator [Streptacidiphilus sp. PAMC 29251]
MAIIKTEALYKQVANEMRAAITSGAWAPGSQIPPEDQLSALYEVSRPTVRQAVASLRTEGLLDVHQGRGSFVRAHQGDSTVPMEQAITRTGARYTTGDGHWHQAEPPTTVHQRIDPQTAAQLAMAQAEGEAAFTVDSLMAHQPSGTRALHRMILPLETITGTPLAKNPAVTPAKAYAILATAHGNLEWRETVTARMPHPDERTTLHLAEAVPLLISHRLTRTQADHRPLILETTTLGAGSAQFAYTVHATGPSSTRPRTRQP